MTSQKLTLPSGAVPHTPQWGEVGVSGGTPALARWPHLCPPPMEPLGATSGGLRHPHPSFMPVVSLILLLHLVFLPSVRAEPGTPERGHRDPPSDGGVAAPPGAGRLPPPGAGSQPPGTEGGPPEMEVGVAESEPGAATARLATWDVQHGRQGRLHVACRALSLVSVNCAPLQGARLAGDDRPLSCHGHRVSATHASHHQGGVALVWKDTSHWQVAATRKMLAASQPWSKIAWLCTREDLMSRESTSARRKIKNEGLVRHWCTSICILNSELRLSYLIRSNITSRGRRQQ